MTMDKEFEATWNEGEEPAKTSEASALTAQRQEGEAKAAQDFRDVFSDKPAVAPAADDALSAAGHHDNKETGQ